MLLTIGWYSVCMSCLALSEPGFSSHSLYKLRTIGFPKGSDTKTCKLFKDYQHKVKDITAQRPKKVPITRELNKHMQRFTVQKIMHGKPGSSGILYKHAFLLSWVQWTNHIFIVFPNQRDCLLETEEEWNWGTMQVFVILSSGEATGFYINNVG